MNAQEVAILDRVLADEGSAPLHVIVDRGLPAISGAGF